MLPPVLGYGFKWKGFPRPRNLLHGNILPPDYMAMRQQTKASVPAVEGAIALEAKLFRGLSDPSRLLILRTLRDGEAAVSEIVEGTGLSQPNVSSHLACLRDCGLVVSRQEGRSVYYTLADNRLEALFRAAEEILARVAERLYDCTRYRP